MKNLFPSLFAAIVVGAMATLFLWKPRTPGEAGERPDPSAAFDPDKPPRKDKFGEDRAGGAKEEKLNETTFDADRAMQYLKQLCDIGTRISGSEGMKKQQELLTKHFETHGATITRQEFEAKQYSRRDKVKMTNLIVSWFPERTRRVILCSHYDTRPMAHQEQNQRDWQKPFHSANDGTSGVAMMMELAHGMKDFPTAVGVDFVLFDGEEYIFEPQGFGGMAGDRFFFGSDHFADEYQRTVRTRKHKYEAAILFDLFAHPGARFPIEGHSFAKAEQLVKDFWGAAAKVQAKSFEWKLGGDVSDDHLALNRVGIPAIDIIDFDGYQTHWHKLSDTPDKCDGKQMAEVAKVTTTWLKSLK